MHYGSIMSTITLKNVPPDTHKALKHLARVHGRSLNKEIIATLQNSVHSTPIDADSLAREARVVRENVGAYLTQRELDALKKAGRR